MRYHVRVEHEGIVKDDPKHQAVLFYCGGSEVWIPRSQMESYSEDYMVVPRWLAEERDLDYEEE